MIQRPIKFRHEFVETLPPQLDRGIIYVSMGYATAAHLCACGCGHEVVTPFGPTDWKLIFDGESVSLYPSIGNWSFRCRSHYWIDRDVIVWAGDMADADIEASRKHDRSAKANAYGVPDLPRIPSAAAPSDGTPSPSGGRWQRLWQSIKDHFTS